MHAKLEHANLTTSDPDVTAKWMADVFGWRIRWQGETQKGLRAIHLGGDDTYLALFAPETPSRPARASDYARIGRINHLGVIVDDLERAETAVRDAGFAPTPVQDYEPGRRFYFHDADQIEYEVVAYA